jgi:hypothetical protein
MRAVAFSNLVGEEVLDIYPHIARGLDSLIVLKPNGEIHVWADASLEDPPGQPTIDALAPSSGGVHSNYIGQFRAHGGEPPV